MFRLAVFLPYAVPAVVAVLMWGFMYGDQFGLVTTMGARYTSVSTRDGREYLVSNEDFITQKVVNWSYSHEEIEQAGYANAP